MRLNRFAVALILGIATALPNGGYENSGGNGNCNPVEGGGDTSTPCTTSTTTVGCTTWVKE
jgi:hypothetical protein